MAKTTQSASYAELSQELAEVMARLEQGDLDIDEAVQSYDRGLQIVKQLEALLLKSENRVSQLRASYDELHDSEKV